jgi:peptidoglycan hydrolase-like protein with peptidoglycan-binding domain
MELLAFVHTAVYYEDPAPDPAVTLPSIPLKVPNSAGVAFAGMAIAVAAVSTFPEKAAAATTSVGVGSTGEEVVQVQKALGIKADGHYGQKTTAAVMDFQIRQGLSQVDGVVGQETATALGLSEKYQPTYVGYVYTNRGVGLNIRSGPGIDYRRIGGLEEGTVVDTYGETVSYYYDDYHWQRIDPGEWVATDYVTPYYEETSYYGDYYDCYDSKPVSNWHDDYWNDDYYYSPSSYSRGGGYVDTYYNVGLNIRSGPGLDYYIEDAVPDGTYLHSVDGTVYRDGYAWEKLPDGSWFAADYVD